MAISCIEYEGWPFGKMFWVVGEVALQRLESEKLSTNDLARLNEELRELAYCQLHNIFMSLCPGGHSIRQALDLVKKSQDELYETLQALSKSRSDGGAG